MCINSFENGNVEGNKLVRGHWVGGGKVVEWTQKHNFNVMFMSFSNMTSICDLGNGEL